jgi:excinuclease ABC subunit A
VIKTADYLIDLGPEGGEGGGHVVAVGTPEQVAQVEASYTGHALRRVLTTARSSRPSNAAGVKGGRPADDASA